jgi:hypothetical protein
MRKMDATAVNMAVCVRLEIRQGRTTVQARVQMAGKRQNG